MTIETYELSEPPLNSYVVSTVNYLSRLGGIPPKLNGWEFLTHMRPLEDVGGDFVHWYNPHNFNINKKIVKKAISVNIFKEKSSSNLSELVKQRSRVGLSLIDVMHHGPFAAKHVPDINNTLIEAIDVELEQNGNVTTNLARYFGEYENFAKETFFSLLYSEFDKTDVFKFFSMGHHQPHVWDVKSKKLVQLKSETGPIIGAPYMKIPEVATSYKIKKDQIIIISSDGLMEHGSHDTGNAFPLEKIILKIQGKAKYLDLFDLKEGIKYEMDGFASFKDDVTFILAKKL